MSPLGISHSWIYYRQISARDLGHIHAAVMAAVAVAVPTRWLRRI